MKSFLLKIYTWGLLSKERVNHFQKIARNEEWLSIKEFIPQGSKFLDVGCGAGYSMLRAQEDCQCEVFGIDPEPMGHGVGRTGSNFNINIENIKQGFSEKIEFETASFDIVYSSHVLEHVNSEAESLKEMNRVLKENGVLIIGIPTATMASINWISQLLFFTHIKIVSLLFGKFINGGKYKWWELILPQSHSFSNKSLLYDIKHYRIKNWEGTISKEFEIKKVILPALYPYPEFRQLFKLRKSKRFSSSVFFICSKKIQY